MPTKVDITNVMDKTEEAILKNYVAGAQGLKSGPPPANKPAEPIVVKRPSTGNVSFEEIIGEKLPKHLPNFQVTTFKPADWDEAIRDEIPEIDMLYNPKVDHLHALLLAWEEREPVLCYGPTGSGKTSLVRYACAITSRPFFRINGSGDMESGPLFGQPTVDIDAKTGQSVYRWNDGVITEAVRHGATVLFDEPFLVPPEISAGLNPLLEEGGKLVLNDKAGSYRDKVVEPDSRFRIVYADNTGGLGDSTGSFAGVQIQNTATLDRFMTTLYVDYLSSDEEMELLKNRFPKQLSDDFIRQVLQFAHFVRMSYIQGQLSFTMSPRTLISWCRKFIIYGNVKQALGPSFLRKFRDESELSAIERHFMTVFGEELN